MIEWTGVTEQRLVCRSSVSKILKDKDTASSNLSSHTDGDARTCVQSALLSVHLFPSRCIQSLSEAQAREATWY